MNGRKKSGHRGHAVGYWLRHYTTNRKVAGWIPDEVIFLNLPNPSVFSSAVEKLKN
jgi:hypothetical protein